MPPPHRLRFDRALARRGLYFFVALATALLTVPLPAALAAAVAATLIEPLPLPLDDNLTIPLASATGAILAPGV